MSVPVVSGEGWRIRTGRDRVPWRWVAAMSLPWASIVYFDLISNVAITFKLREFIRVPLLLTLVGSFNLLFNVLMGASCNYASDRVWTRWGRRKPFLVVGWSVVAVGCLILPSLHHFWLMVGLLFVYEMLRDLATPYESLCNEVVPSAQRGRANAAFTFARQGMIAVFFWLVIGRWDEQYTLPGGFTLSGQHLVFWSAAAMAIITLGLVSRVREEAPPGVWPTWRWPRGRDGFGHVRTFFHEVFGSRQWRAIYTVALAQMVFWMDLGNLAPLLYTEQWGFSKQGYGNVLAIVSAMTLAVFLPLGGWIGDRCDRFRVFQVCAGAMMLHHLVFFLVLQMMGRPPTFYEVVGFKLLETGIGTVGTISSVAMMFDYVPRHRLGTVLAGVGLSRGLASLVVNNGVGLWVTTAAWIWPDRDDAGERKYDYALGYLYLGLFGLLAFWVARRFARLSRAGELIKLGVEDAPPFKT
ncbi:MAG TPA: MFS transporter [Opitutaceae bacterium]|nr:MFS transporter [Opitutaceae bacterium]